MHVQTPQNSISNQRRILELDIERYGLWAGLFCAVFGLIVGLIVFADQMPMLFGGLSVGSTASVTAGVGAGVASAYAFRSLLRYREPWLRRIPRWRQYIVGLGLVTVHVASTIMITLVGSYLIGQAFIGLHLDVLAGSLLVAAITGFSAYLCLVATARTNAENLSVVLGIYMAAGVLISMLLAEDQSWWQRMFSRLGTSQSGLGSFWTFNTTMVISGLVLAAFTEFLTRDLNLLAQGYRCRPSLERYPLVRRLRPRPAVVRWCLVVVSVGVIGIGSVPMDLLPEVHSAFVQLASGAMILLLVGTVVLLPGYPAVFHLMSASALGALWFSFLLWSEWSYFNLTGFELCAVAILFAWISVFIRTTAAMSRDRRKQHSHHRPAPVDLAAIQSSQISEPKPHEQQ